jgi:hypothetical protein
MAQVDRGGLGIEFCEGGTQKPDAKFNSAGRNNPNRIRLCFPPGQTPGYTTERLSTSANTITIIRSMPNPPEG